MSDAKPFASLTPTLLARKGAARPAMRPQIQPLNMFHESAARDLAGDPGHDDLGWNDMGHDVGPAAVPPQGEVVQFVPAAAAAPEAPVAHPAEPEVLRLQEEVAQRVSAVVAIAPRSAPRPRRSAINEGRKAAFTLRVDAERHLKLRLACTIKNRSAQQIVTEALDRLLEQLPEVASLAAQVGKRG